MDLDRNANGHTGLDDARHHGRTGRRGRGGGGACRHQRVLPVGKICAAARGEPAHVVVARVCDFIGLGLRRDAREVRWKTVGEMLLAWIVTLPVAAAIAYFVLRSAL